ncbi:hypothetical protein EDD16DRAFT_1582911 [Pisolithus croceorrhizus]|nr:hypothetical protein EDD16DRAFT_1582911 [Pisolithus croceorrhizus]KAI6160576.1 hypothetical protein EDD17DRAFT_1599815 [Pisolithus thermaeus]
MVSQVLLRIFDRFSKLLNAAAKRVSSIILPLFRSLLTFWNALVQKWKGTRLLENRTERVLAPTPSSADVATVTKVGEDDSIRPATILCSEVPRVGVPVLLHPPTISRTATSTSATTPLSEVGDPNGQFALLNSASDIELRPYTSGPRVPVQPKRPSFQVGKFSSKLLAILILLLETIPTFFFLNGSLSIMRAVRAMQDGQQTDIKKFKGFWAEFQKRLHAVILMATVLLTANIAFLAIPSVDGQGLAYLPQKCSYISIMFNLGGIAGGYALRMPRVLKGGSLFYLDTISLILGFPSTLFLFGVFFFFFALIFHIGNSGAGFWLYWTFTGSAIFWLVYAGLYLVITEPLEKRLYSSPPEADEETLTNRQTPLGLSVMLSWNK